MNIIEKIDDSRLKNPNFIYGLAGDPPHIGHIQAIKHLLKVKDSIVWVILSASHAYGKKMAPYFIRKDWLNTLIFNTNILNENEKSRIIFKDIELEILEEDCSKKTVYSIDLKQYLEKKYNKNFVWAFGIDNVNEDNIKKFKDYKSIIEWSIFCIPEFFSLHSTEIRKEIKNKNYVFLEQNITVDLSKKIIDWVGQPQGSYWIENRDI